MSIEGNSNVSPKGDADATDFRAMLREGLGEVKAEILAEVSKIQASGEDTGGDAVAAVKAAGGDVRPRRKTLHINDKPAEELDAKGRALKAVRTIKYLAQAGGRMSDAIDIAEKAGDTHLAKAMQASQIEDGGALLAPEYADGVIELLTPRSTVLASGVGTTTMPEGGLSMAYEKEGVTSSYVGEGDGVNATQMKLGMLNLSPRKLITIVGISNDLLRAAPGKSDGLVLNSIIRAMGSKLDITLLRSDGSENRPQGLLYQAAAANKKAATTGTLSLAGVTRDLIVLIDALEGNDVTPESENGGWIMAPRTKNYLKTIRVGTNDGQFAFPSMEDGTLMLFPFKSTSQIPTNLDYTGDADNDESEIYFGAFAHMLFAENENLLVQVHPGGAYLDASGNTRSGISHDETPISVISKHDFGCLQRGDEVAILQGVDWKF